MTRIIGPLAHLRVMAALACGLTGTLAASTSEAPSCPAGQETVRLKVSLFKDVEQVPIAAEHAIGKTLPVALVGREVAVEEARGNLRIDTGGDGTFARRVTPRRPATFELETKGGRLPLLVYREGERWCAASASSVVGELFDLSIRLIDSDLDGRFLGAGDHMAVGSGVPVACGEGRVALIGKRLYELELDASRRRPELTVKAIERPEGVSISQWRALLSLARFRASVGLPPVDLDATRSAGCQRHADYLYLNAYDFTKPWDGVGSHGEVEGHPGYSAEGVEAGKRGVIGAGGVAADQVRIMSTTMLHRISFLGPASIGAGVGEVRKSKSEGASGYTVLWCGRDLFLPEATPIVVPAPGQVDVPLVVEPEQPAPESEPDLYSAPRGYPISVTFGARPLRGVDLQLFRIKGKKDVPVPGSLFTPEAPVHSTRPLNAGTAFFLSKKPLPPETRFRAVFHAKEDGQPLSLTWTFTTAAKER